jgi:alpha-1,6-mannosyltransferase
VNSQRPGAWFSSPFPLSKLILIFFGGALLVLYRYGLTVEGAGTGRIVWFIRLALTQGLLYLGAAWIVWRARPNRLTLLVVVLFAALFRLSILFAPPLLSDDVYRYVWDGRVQAAGINPYRYIPSDETLTLLRDESIYPNINRRDFAPTIYPPLAEAIYFLSTRVSESVTWMKATMMGFEAVTIWALMALLASFGLPRQRALIYAWHPLIVWEFAGSGHIDAIAITFIALALLARRRQLDGAAGVALACATLVKFFPAILFPALYRRWGWKMPVLFVLVIAIAYVPYLSVGVEGVFGYLPGYMAEEGMRSGERFFILAAVRKVAGEANIPRAAFFIFVGLIVLGIAAWCVLKPKLNGIGYIVRAFALAAIFTILLSPRYAWYFAWLIPFLCFVPFVPIFYLTVTSFILYALWLGEAERRFAIDLALYIPFAALAAISFWMRRRVREPGSADIPARDTMSGRRQAGTPALPGQVSVVIPALNEESTIAGVIRAVPRDIAGEVIVADNGSDDRTVERARDAGARVVHESRRGYGSACYAGFRACSPDSEIIVFLDGDGSDYPEMMARLVQPIADGTHDFVISSRIQGRREPGSMLFQQVFAGHAVGLILRALYGVHYTDMGPFRAIRRSALDRLGMREMTYGWPLEMQMRAARLGLRILEVPVDYRRRAGGQSKISGTVSGTLRAGARIALTLARIAFE